MRKLRVIAILIIFLVFNLSVSAQSSTEIMRFAEIGDYGQSSVASGEVATLVASWDVDFVITTGDNIYNDNYEADVGNYYGAFVAAEMFFPVPGNHDDQGALVDYCAYFSYLPFPCRYYWFEMNDIFFDMMNTDFRDPHGNKAGSIQNDNHEQWIQDSTACYKIQVGHHVFASRGSHGDGKDFRHDLVVALGNQIDVHIRGHNHSAETIFSDAFGWPEFVNGIGGGTLTDFSGTLRAGYTSALEYWADHGAALWTLTDNGDGTTTLRRELRNTSDVILDTWSITKPCATIVETPTATISSPISTSTPEPTATGTPVPPTSTSTATDTLTPTPTSTATSTPTSTSMPTATPIATATETLISPVIMLNVGDVIDYGDSRGKCTIVSISEMSGGVKGGMFECTFNP